MGTVALGAVLAGLGTISALLALYLVVLALASFGAHATRRPHASPCLHLAVLVPAHDEEAVVGRCVRSLLAQSYPRHLVRVVVVADNCSDATAAIAQAAGAEVLTRFDQGRRGKGQALRWAIDRLLAGPLPPDAVVIVDADSVADRDLLVELVAGLERGQAVQGEYLVLPEDGSGRTRLAEAGFLLFHRVRLGGRARLGLPSALVGNGMILARELLERHPWDAFSGVEDLEYTLRLRLDGVRPVYAPAARVWGPPAVGYPETARQRTRWEGGRLHLMRSRVWRLLRAGLRDPRLLDAAVDLAVPPLALFGLGVVTGSAIALAWPLLGLQPGWWVPGPWLAAAALLPTFVFLGLVAAGASRRHYLALLEAPRFLFWKLTAYGRLLQGFDPAQWERTARTIHRSASPGPFEIAGVRIDAVTMDEARSRIRAALSGHVLYQVSTVNTDFLARAQRSSEVRRALSRSSLNLPDGAPVVWLGRLLGRRVPERVAGADLVPLLVVDAAELGVGVFLLGGEGGAAAAAAARWSAAIPGLRICWHEPPRAPLGQMEDEEIIRRVRDSGARLLLVAFGHPKQELWIHRQRDRLPVSVAIGVGCVLDLAAGRARRAPGWMRRTGLEWLYRLAHEPRRLGGRYASDLRWLSRIAAGVLLERMTARRPRASLP